VYSDERFPASLLSSWFGQGMTSHLFQKLREELGLVYFVHSHISTFLDQGFFLIETSCELQNMPEVIEIIFSEVKKLQSKTFSKALLNSQKRLLRGQVLLGAEDLENRMQSIALNELIFQQYRSPLDYLRKFEKIDGYCIKKFIRDRLRFDQCAVVLYGHKAKEFKPFIDNIFVSVK
jgi:predicted Zn-dependent peptidase